MTSSEKNHKDRKFSFLGLSVCSSDSFLGCFFQRCLDTGITGKLIGMLVVSLLGLAIVIILNTVSLQKIARGDHAIRDVSIPQYKIGQYILRSINGFKISLLHVLNTPGINEENRHVLDNRQRLSDMGRMIGSLQHGGPVQDVAKVADHTLDVFIVKPSDDPRMKALIADIDAEYQLLNRSYGNFVSSLVNTATKDERG